MEIEITYFHNNKAPETNVNYKCLAQVRVESISRKDALECYTQVYLEQCKYEVRSNRRNNRRNMRIDYGYEKRSSD